MIDISELRATFERLLGETPEARAQSTARVVAPSIVLFSTLSGLLGANFGLNIERPFTISVLRTEASLSGSATPRMGIALIVEPVDGQYRLQMHPPPTRIWSSLDLQGARSNRGGLTLDGIGGVIGKTPLLGISDPFAVILEGELEKKIFLPGRTVDAENWQLPSRRSESLVFSVLMVCVLALGWSLGGLPSDRREKYSGRKKRA